MPRSSALRRSGLAMRSRATASAGKSSSSLPPARRSSTALLQDDEDVAFADRLALLAADLLDDAVVFGLHRDLHLHRLEDDDGVAILDLIADRDCDFPDVPRDVRLDVCHGGAQYPVVSPDPFDALAVLVAARNEADRVGETVAALRGAFPGAPIWVADDASADGTAEAAMAAGARVVSRGRPHGKGGNVTAAAKAALSDDGAPPEFVLLCDADLGS